MKKHIQYLFWKAQIGILNACPPLCGIVSRHSLGAQNSPKVWAKTLLRLAAQMPCAMLVHADNLRHRRIVLPRVSLLVTTRCTLNCDKCLARIPDLQCRAEIPTATLLDDIRHLLACVDSIYALILTGGEAFLHPDLDQILHFCAASGKISNISVQTNGTVIPDEALLAALKQTGATVKISNYPLCQPHVQHVKSVLKVHGIHYTHESAVHWRDIGVFGVPQEGDAKRRFSICAQRLCAPFLDGKLHLCGESALLLREGMIPMRASDYIDLRSTSPTEFAAQWKRLQEKRVITACSFCLGNTCQTPKIPVAVQRDAS